VIANEADTTMDNLKFLPTCSDSLIMGFSIDLCWRARHRVMGLAFFGSSQSPAFPWGWFSTDGCDSYSQPGIAHRGLVAAVGSQFFTAPNHGASHSGEAGVRVFEPGASRAINGRGHATVRVCVA
jgi:hypothetical protein